MSGATTYCIIYNGTQEAHVYDEDGRALDPGSFACARRSTVRDLIDRGVLVVVDPETIGDDSVPAARMAKEDVAKKNAEIDKEKADAAKAPAKSKNIDK